MKNLPLLCWFLLACARMAAQPLPCGPTPEMTSFCEDACIICDINGFTGINDDPETGEAPPGFCTNTVHHMQWIGFIAGSSDLTLSVHVFNCQSGNGLEVAIYETFDCEQYTLVSNCDGDIQPNTTQLFSNTQPLTIGQYYYFVMDGNGDDVCKYTINVVEGTTAVSELPNSGDIAGDVTLCPGRTETYQLDPPSGATWYTWQLDGAVVAAGLDSTLTLGWNAPGTHNLCAIASNVCDTAPPTCRLITVQPIPPTIIPVSLCEGECWAGADTTLCDAGIYEFHFEGQETCDSLVRVEVEVIPVASASLDLLICEGDSIFIGGVPFFTTGVFQQKLQTGLGCDSVVQLDLEVIVCEIEGNLQADSVRCFGTATGTLHFQVENGTPPLHYSWEKIGSGQPSGNGDILALNTEEVLENLPSGTYFITITDNFGNDAILFTDLKEPLAFQSTYSVSIYQDKNVSCAGATDGVLEVLPYAGTPPYSFQWSTGSTMAELISIGAGIYTCTLSDSKGCTLTVSETLLEPAPIVLETQFDNPDCGGANTGAITVLSVSGGTPPYQFDLSGNGFGPASAFSSLSSGNYVLTVRDTNGCETSANGVLTAPLIPDVELGSELSIDLADSVRLSPLLNIPLDSFFWSPATGLSCTDCEMPYARPFVTTTYVLRVVAPGEGCADVDSVTVRVLDVRDVYVPNMFSPNDENGLNDFFTVYAGPEALIVKRLDIYSRWGELIFHAEDLLPNRDAAGWDGKFRGRFAPSGVYTWVAVISFLDGVEKVYEGDVTLFR